MAPLFVSRVPTVYSLQQLEEEYATPEKGALSHPLKPVGDLTSSLLPRLACLSRTSAVPSKRIRSFGDLQAIVPDSDEERSLTDFSDEDGVVPQNPPLFGFGEGSSLLDTVLLAEWEDRAEQGLFRYDVTACPTKVLPGAYGFVAQLNEGRGSKKRPTEFRVDKVDQPFDEGKFNFKKALQQEVLFQFDASAPGGLTYSASAPVSQSPNLVFINISPIEYGHVLLVPRVLDGLHQVVDQRSMQLALNLCHESNNPYFRLCYNSLGAFGTVNHLHFQAYFLAAPFAVERVPVEPIPAAKGLYSNIIISRLLQYPVRGLVFEADESAALLAPAVAAACQRLTAANIPHNLFVVDCGQRVFLFPNAFAGAKAAGRVPKDLLDTMVDPAGFEICGHIIMKRAEDYEDLSQQSIWRLLEYASFTEEEFEKFILLALDL
ncbi:hypothetical protein WJX74_003514 [Apatococcus lobatus]|uniref:GDP-D-glucose phosphorylase 1 n=2 Tax=Apatococcus TaxID=904362 RepID=A0AAW1T135_9CHLO